MKNLFAVISLLLCLAFSSYAGPGRPSFSSRPSYSGGFRSSSSPSRTFTFRSSPSTYSRPAAAPRSYTYSAPKATIATPVSRSTVKRTVINNHYHGDGGHGSSGGGISAGDLLMYHALTSHDHGPTYVNTQPVVAGGAYSQPVVASDPYQDGPAVIYQREESHFWRNTFLVILGAGCFYGLFRLFRYLAASV